MEVDIIYSLKLYGKLIKNSVIAELLAVHPVFATK